MKPVGASREKQAMPLTPQVAPTPYPMRLDAPSFAATDGARDAFVATRSAAAALMATRIASGGTDPERQSNVSAWSWSKSSPRTGSGPWADAGDGRAAPIASTAIVANRIARPRAMDLVVTGAPPAAGWSDRR